MSNLATCLPSQASVIQALLRYTDWWQPATASVLNVGAARRASDLGDGFSPGLLDTLDERRELCRRMQRLEERDRDVLFLWYVKQLDVFGISRALGISRRQCFRRRSRAVHRLVALGDQDLD